MEINDGKFLQHGRNEEDRELDAELEAIFDDEGEEAGLGNLETATVLADKDDRAREVPQSPERVFIHEKRPKSILDALVARKETLRLTSHAAAIANEAAALVDGVHNISAKDQGIQEMLIQKEKSNRCEGAQRLLSNTLGRNRTELMCVEASNLKASQERVRKARNAFRVVGATREQSGASRYDIAIRNVSNMSLLRASVDAARLDALFEHTQRVDISELTTRIDDARGGRLGEWVLFGCIVKRHGKREAKDGSKFAVWSLCNMPRWPLQYQNNNMICNTTVGGENGNSNRCTKLLVKKQSAAKTLPVPTSITLLVFGDAFTSWHNLIEGSAIALRTPAVLPPRGSEIMANNSNKPSERGGAEWCGHCIRVSRSDQIMTLGTCADYRTCTEPSGDGEVCGVWYDANRSSMCSRHTQRKRQRLILGTRMDVNNAERPGPRADAVRFASDYGAAIDISRAPTQINNSTVSRKIATIQNMVNADDIDSHIRKAEADAKRIAALKNRANARRQVSVVNGNIGNGTVISKNGVGPSGGGIAKLSSPASLSQMRALAAPKARECGRVLAASRLLKRGREQCAQALKEEIDRTNNDVKKLNQRKLDVAVDTLLKVGYSLTIDGDLLAPTQSKATVTGLAIRKGKVPSVRTKSLSRSRSDASHDDNLCLSDESEESGSL